MYRAEDEGTHGFSWERAAAALEFAFRETFPEITERQIKRIIAKLKKDMGC